MFNFTVYANQSIKEWYGNQNFTFSEDQNELSISINKKPWESFTLKIDNFELMNNPVVNIQMKVDQDLVLRIDISDGFFVSSEINIIEKSIISSDSFVAVNFDFTNVLSDIDLIQDIQFLKEIKLSNDFIGNDTNFENSLNIYPSPATDFAFIEIPEGTFSCLKVYDITAKEVFSIDARNFSASEYKFDLNDLKEGCYVVKLISSNQTINGKLIIN